jgi:hypothetical protein
VLQDFVSAPEYQNQVWDLVIATFSLQNIPPAQLPQLLLVLPIPLQRVSSALSLPLQWLRKRTRTLLIAEFDVQHFANFDEKVMLDVDLSLQLIIFRCSTWLQRMSAGFSSELLRKPAPPSARPSQHFTVHFQHSAAEHSYCCHAGTRD